MMRLKSRGRGKELVVIAPADYSAAPGATVQVGVDLRAMIATYDLLDFVIRGEGRPFTQTEDIGYIDELKSEEGFVKTGQRSEQCKYLYGTVVLRAMDALGRSIAANYPNVRLAH